MYIKQLLKELDVETEHVHCNNSLEIEVDLEMAFQPIVDMQSKSIFAYEALVRGKNGESAYEVLGKIKPDQLYRFDQTCRVLAINSAAKLGMTSKLCINFFPNAIYDPASCVQVTLAAAQKCNFAIEQIIFEVSETEKVVSFEHIKTIFAEYEKNGLSTAIDDFGAGYSGLNLLANFQPSIIKLDIGLIRDININSIKLAIVAGVVKTCQILNILVIAEGVETQQELTALYDIGVHMFQGYLFAEPKINMLPLVDFERTNLMTNTFHA